MPLLLLPGLLCDEAVWSSQMDALAPYVDCLVPDYGGFASIKAMAEHALSAVPAERFAIAGHSMGGRVALEVLRVAPTRVTGLALLDTGYQSIADGDAGQRERNGRLRLLEIARGQGMRAMGEQWAPGMVHPDRVGMPLYQSILDMIARSTPEKFEAQIEALLGRPDASSLLPEITCATMIVCGREDTWSPLLRHEAMHLAVADSTLRIIEHCGHMSTMEQPELVSAALLEWIDRISVAEKSRM